MSPIDEDYIDIQGKDDDDEQDEKEEEDDDDDNEDDEEDTSTYSKLASSEFEGDGTMDSTKVDWGGALGKLRERMGDVNDPTLNAQGGKARPSNALFRTMLAEGTPNQAILKFVQEAKPDVVSAMSGAVGSLLGGLSNPAMGVETIIKADGEKLGNLCFQLQMTGYMFRNAEYVLALKDLMNLEVNAELEQYKQAFDELDQDGSGYIDKAEIQALLQSVYDENADDDDDNENDNDENEDGTADNDNDNNNKVPPYEVEAFLRFFDMNHDGKISWEEFKKGFDTNARKRWDTFSTSMEQMALEGSNKANGNDNNNDDNDNDEDEKDYEELEHALENAASISGIIQVELENGKIIDVEAKDYIQGLKEEAKALRQALLEEAGSLTSNSNTQSGSPLPGGAMSSPATTPPAQNDGTNGSPNGSPNTSGAGSIGQYIATLGEKNIKKLTDGISPEVVDAMKLLINYVLDQGHTKGEMNGKRSTDASGSKNNKKQQKRNPKDEMEIAGSALQQLALWQLVLGYRLREQEATGSWKRLLDQ
jgi:hypothetical protein